MRWEFVFGLLLFIQVKNTFCQAEFGSVYPIPLTIANDDPKFEQCPMESGAYTHSNNCSLFHLCTFGIHTIYSCIVGFFFNPTSGKCQYFPEEDKMKCAEIVKQMVDSDLLPLAEPVKDNDYYHRRKSASSPCNRPGIYPDVLDCSLFHYCHPNRQHEILQCPNGLHFDPKLFICSAPQLVNCQYEPPTEPAITENEADPSSAIESDTICRDYIPGTRLSVANQFDQYLVCDNDGKSTIMKCQSGFHYDALKKNCTLKVCAMDATLCKNDGQCIEETTNKKGFRCLCSIEYQGDYCEKRIELLETTKNPIETFTDDLLQLPDRLKDNNQPLTTDLKVNIDHAEKAIPYTDPKIEDRISIIEKISRTKSPVLRAVHRVYYDSNQEQSDQLIKITFIAILFFVGLILLSSILFGLAICLRLISSQPMETVGTWNILSDKSKV